VYRLAHVAEPGQASSDLWLASLLSAEEDVGLDPVVTGA